MAPQSRAVPCWDPTYTKRSAHHKDLKSRAPRSKTPMTSPPRPALGVNGFPDRGISLSKTKPMDYDSYGCDHFTQDSNFSHSQKKGNGLLYYKEVPKIDTNPKTAKYLRTEAASEIPETCLFFVLKAHWSATKIYTVQKSPIFPIQTWTCKENKNADKSMFPNPRYRVPIKRMAVISSASKRYNGDLASKTSPPLIGAGKLCPFPRGFTGKYFPRCTSRIWSD